MFAEHPLCVGLRLSSDVVVRSVLCDLKRKVMGSDQSQAVGRFAVVTGSTEGGGHSSLSWVPQFLSQSFRRAVSEGVKRTEGDGAFGVCAAHSCAGLCV